MKNQKGTLTVFNPIQKRLYASATICVPFQA